MASPTVIVFGPTGNIASVAAQTAQQDGAKVWLAMRDPQKSIPGLRAEDEKKGGFERVQADLTKPDTVTEAVRKSGAKHAFIYLAHGSQDHMKSTVEALKSGGIEFLVFLSSFTIVGKAKDVPQSEIIPFIHARVEMSVKAVFKPNEYVFVRPGAFATNTTRWKNDINAGQLKLYLPELTYDFTDAGDMGRVSGTILAKGQRDGENIVYVFGPNMVTQRHAAQTIAKALGKDLKITEISEQESIEQNKAIGIPEPIATYLPKRMTVHNRGEEPAFDRQAEGVANVEKYTGRPATGFEEWAQQNKDLFSA